MLMARSRHLSLPDALLVLSLALSPALPALAQSTPADAGSKPSTETERTDRNPLTKGVRVYLGRTQADDDSGLENPSNDATVGVEFGDRIAGTGEYLGYDAGLWLSFRDYDNALDAAVGITDPQIEANWVAVTGGLRLSVPRRSAFRFYAMAGGGIFRSTLSSSGPGYIGKAEDHYTGFGGYAGIGFEYNWPTWGLGLDLRRFWIPADFDDFGIDDVDLGGTFASLVVRKKF
jgi:hypothetical protein